MVGDSGHHGAVSVEKMGELILYFSDKSCDDPYFGSTKLNKLLFLADFWAYAHLGKSITGVTYVHQEHGPTPAPKLFLEVRNTLVSGGRLNMRQEDTFRGLRSRPQALQPPKTECFTSKELDVCNAALDELRHMSAVEASVWSHDFLGWRFTDEGQEIPYSSVFLWRKEPVTVGDLDWARKFADASDA